jgi:hypothetical protein
MGRPTPSDLDGELRAARVATSFEVPVTTGARRSAPGPGPRADRGPDHPGLRVVVTLAHERVEHCDLASAILIRDADLDIIEASDPLAASLDRRQRDVGEGPGIQACTSASMVSSDDLRTDPRWPSFGAHARRDGIAAALAVPLIAERELPGWRGWLALYSRSPGPFPTASVALAQTLGLYGSITVNSALHASHFEAALASRDLIGQAKGIIMARREIDDAAAFVVLKEASQRSNRRLRDVAEAVVHSCGHHGLLDPNID